MKSKYIYYLLVLFLILISGTPIFNVPMLTGSIGVLSFIYFIFNRKRFLKISKLWIYLIFIALIFLCQAVVLGSISILGMFNIMSKICFGTLVMWVLKDKFKLYYLNVMYLLSLISLIFYSFSMLFGIEIPDLTSSTTSVNSIIIYNHDSNSVRNSGAFWEPGAFAGYLLLVPILYIDSLSMVVSHNKKKFIILLLALITTFSTTGYLVLSIIVLYYIINSKNKIISYLFILPIVLIMFIKLYSTSDFLGEKIESQFEMSKDQRADFSNTRIGSLMFDLYYIQKHPIVGNGLDEKTRYSDHPFLWGVNIGNGNGFSNYIAQMGIIAIVVYVILIFKSLGKNISSKLIAVFSVILLLQGEAYLNYPLFLSLPFYIRNIYPRKIE